MDYSRKNPHSSSRGHVGGGIKGSGNPDGREGGVLNLTKNLRELLSFIFSSLQQICFEELLLLFKCDLTWEIVH